MMIRRSLAYTAAAVGALACSEAGAPSHQPLYEWRMVIQPDTLSVHTDTLSFHWPTRDLPVRIWVQDSLDMPVYIQDGIDAWQDAFFFGEYSAVIVSDSSTADMIVYVKQTPPQAPANIGRLQTMFPGCQGATDVDTAATRFQLQLPMRMYLSPKYDPAQSDLSECFRITAMHELGHSLGIFQHSPYVSDVMYSQPVAPALSVRDVNTAQALSHYPANMTPTR